MTFRCLICKKEFSKKWMLKRHNERVFPCNDGISCCTNSGQSKKQQKINIFIKKKEKKNSKNSKNSKNIKNIKNSKNSKNIENSKNIKNIENIKNDKEDKEDKKYKCQFCNKSYKHKQSKFKHLESCKIKLEIINSLKKNTITNIININNTTHNYVNNNITNTSINNTNNINNINNIEIKNINKVINNNLHIHINPFGKENLESITDYDKIKILNNVYEAFPLALKKIYQIRENMNFYLPNKSNKKYVKVFNGTIGVYENTNDFKFKLSQIIINKLESWFNEHKVQIKHQRKINIKKAFHDFNNGCLNNRYFNDIEKYLLTYSNDIKYFFEKEIKIIEILNKKI